ncbi:MAG: ATP-binding protein [Proteobacteria bacterium]|nr:ATP-binding protein [Pseudomonadota bacterium]
MADEPIETTLLAPDRESAETLAHITKDRSFGARNAVRVEIAQGEAEQAIKRVREVLGGVPLGYVARDESDALEAIFNGADEAMVVAELAPREVLVLVERTVLRAEKRREQENVRASYAQSEKLAALGTVVAGVAHEINNPLTAVLLSVEALRSVMTPLINAADEIFRLGALDRAISAAEIADLARVARTGAPSMEGEDILNEMSGAIQAVADVVRDLRIFARTDEQEKSQLVFISEVIDQVIRIVGREITSRGVIERDYASDLPPLVVPRTRLAQVISNILINAAHAIRDVDRPVHRVRISIWADDETVAISISDTGPGIPPDTIERIFDPFFTTKRESVGTGLGLSISRQILRRLGGDLMVESVHGDGATFIALVPRPSADDLREAYKRATVISGASAVTMRATVMLVDDDQRIVRAYSRVLRDHYDLILASDGQEAIDLLSSGSSADAIITDLLLPEVDGTKLYDWLSRERPELARTTIFVIAATTATTYSDFLDRVENPILEKPVSREQLLAAIQLVLPTV